MLNVYFGENTYALFRKKAEVFQKLKDKNVEIVYYDSLEQVDIDDLSQILAGGGLFTREKVVIFKDVLSEKGFEPKVKLIYEVIKNTDGAGANNIYFFDEKPDKKSAFFRYLKKNARGIKEFKNFKGKDLEDFLVKEAQCLEVKIEKREIARLCFLVNYQIWPAINELKKLNAYKKGVSIEMKDINELVRFELTNDIFKTIDALGKGDKRLAMELIHRHLDSGDDGFYLFSMFVYQFRNLIKVKSAVTEGVSYPQIAKSTGLHPFVAQKCNNFSQRFSFERLRALYKKLAEIDVSVKTGGLEVSQALDMFVAFC